MKNYLSNLASTLQGIAGVISDGERVQHECPTHLKSALLEASHALDGQSVRVAAVQFVSTICQREHQQLLRRLNFKAPRPVCCCSAHKDSTSK